MILKFGREGLELDDLAERIAILEQSATDGGAKRKPNERPHRKGSPEDEQEDEA